MPTCPIVPITPFVLGPSCCAEVGHATHTVGYWFVDYPRLRYSQLQFQLLHSYLRFISIRYAPP